MTATYNNNGGDVDMCQRVCAPNEQQFYEPTGTYFAQIFSNTLDSSNTHQAIDSKIQFK